MCHVFRHSIPECGDMNSRCSMFSQYCNMEFMRINGVPIKELCAYTCGLCPQLPSPPTTTTTTTPMNIVIDIKINHSIR